MTHTPGPWRVNKYGSVGAGERGTTPITCSVEPFYGSDKQYGDHTANARLIAAAPEMLEALQAILAMSDEGYMNPGTSDRWFERIEDTARAAIAKATGEA